MLIQHSLSCVALCFGLTSTLAAGDDLFIADFEASDYGSWKVEGKAFGSAPATGTLPGQMQVSGYRGKRLVNSFVGGDVAEGTLTSPEFKIERPYINFLIGGGKYPNETCMQLLVDGKVRRSATGPNDKPGGTEALDWDSWEVRGLVGQIAAIRIVDRRSGGWGHINVDHITQSNHRKQAEPATRTIPITGKYLHFPVATGAPPRRVRLRIGDASVREFDLELAHDLKRADFVAFADVSAWKGELLTIDAGRFAYGNQALTGISQSNEQPAFANLYKERDRPQFHFTSRRGWLNDPNGLVYDQGNWHLFYQHNPYGWNWGNMHWGHAVSKDLIHWQELGEAIHPWSDCKGAAFSGSGLVDRDNTAGFKTGKEDVLIAALTDTGAGESIAYSNDRGRTWTMYEGNPVVRHRGRDPKIIWHTPTKRWVMAVYDEFENKRYIAFYSSANLKAWKFESRLEGFYECPDIFELPVDEKPTERKWVLYAADAKYVLGQFDGRTFTPEHTGKHQLWYGNFYAAQTYFGAPNARRVQIGWGRGITFPGMPFNQQMSIPVELTLRRTSDGIRMFAEPVREIETLREESFELSRVALNAEPRELDLRGELLDIRARLSVDDSAVVKFNIRGVDVVYQANTGQIHCGPAAPLASINGSITLRILVDRGSIELFGNHGQVAISHGVRFEDSNHKIHVSCTHGIATLTQMTVNNLSPAW